MNNRPVGCPANYTGIVVSGRSRRGRVQFLINIHCSLMFLCCGSCYYFLKEREREREKIGVDRCASHHPPVTTFFSFYCMYMCAGLFFFRLSQKSVIAPLQVIWPRAVKQPQGEIIVVKFYKTTKYCRRTESKKFCVLKMCFIFLGAFFQSLWKRKDERNLPLPVFVYGMCDALPRRNKADKSLLLLLYTAGGRGRSWRARAARVIKWVLSSNFHIWIERQWRNPMGLREGGSSKVVFVTVVWFFFFLVVVVSLLSNGPSLGRSLLLASAFYISTLDDISLKSSVTLSLG